MMNNKGFTLIELLAVIIILVSISLIAVSGISASLERRYENECSEQIKLAKNAAKIYFSVNNCTVKTDSDTCNVSVASLKDGYFNEKNKTDRLTDNDSVSFTTNGYIFNGMGECKES